MTDSLEAKKSLAEMVRREETADEYWVKSANESRKETEESFISGCEYEAPLAWERGFSSGLEAAKNAIDRFFELDAASPDFAAGKETKK